MTATTPIRTALLLPDVLDNITEFQYGIQLEMLELAHLESLRMRTKWDRPNLFSQDNFALFDAILTPWYEAHGTTRLYKMQHPFILAPILCHAIYKRRIPILAYLDAIHFDGFTVEAMECAAQLGALDVVAWLNARQYNGRANAALNVACELGDLELVQFLHSHLPVNVDSSSYDCLRGPDIAASKGFTDIVQFLLEHFPSNVFSYESLDLAISNGHHDVARLLAAHRPDLCNPWSLQFSLMNCVSRNDLAMLEILQTMNWAEEVVLSLLDLANREGHMEIVKFFFTVQVPDMSNPIDIAAKYGQLDVIRRLLESEINTQLRTTNALDWAAEHGHLEVVEFLTQLRDEGCTTRAMDDAAANGHFEIVEYLHRSLKTSTTEAVDGAASNGHLPIVEFLLANRCEGYTQKAIDGAAANGHLNIVLYFENLDLKCSLDGLTGAASNGHLNIVEYLASHQPELFSTDVMDAAAKGGQLEVVKWLHEHRNEGCTVRAIDGAAANDHFEMVEWLGTHRTEGYQCAVQKAVLNNNVRMARYLRQYCTYHPDAETSRRLKKLEKKVSDNDDDEEIDDDDYGDDSDDEENSNCDDDDEDNEERLDSPSEIDDEVRPC
ncbi:unnamed protein product [Aphanomyces euteiches]|uniref:Uncharacterized protein n=1 Tax=Aphanomyces euteiches TaxID=100861 RepID=A0A6G0X7C8_9STRA|nr:hypothetical protein Ae201684_007842 [Aphanomyces euteiches]KAH9067318.1 hypothetical protein Ae201684P_021478 [Aphanomyces euteiches]KAH9142715.1 hypothetical protein AeRB84_013237 [Aphanomyces euteiches]